MGRPTIYNEQIAKEICIRLCRGESLRSICKDDKIPHIDTVLTWAMDRNHPFSDQYARARDIQADTLADEIQDIADDKSEDTFVGEKGELKINYENIQRSKLRVDTRKWIASKLKPKRYGDKLDMQVSSPESGGIALEVRNKYFEMLKDPKSAEAIKLLNEKLDSKDSI